MQKRELFWKTAETAWDVVRLSTVPLRVVGYTGIAFGQKVSDAIESSGGLPFVMYEVCLAFPGAVSSLAGIGEIALGNLGIGALATSAGVIVNSPNIYVLGSSVAEGIKKTYEHGVEKKAYLRHKRAARRLLW